LITALFFVMGLANGKSLGAALTHSLESLPFLIWVHVLMVAACSR